MIARVNEEGIVLQFGAKDNLTPEQWKSLLDELQSEPPLLVHSAGGGATIRLTPETVTADAAMAILETRNIEVLDVRENRSHG